MAEVAHACRKCVYLIRKDGRIYCTEQRMEISAEVAKSPNRCHSFAYTPVDVLGLDCAVGSSRGKRGRRKQPDGQLQLDVSAMRRKA